MSEKKMGKNPFAPIVHYFKDVRGEMKKVVWPTYKQIQNNTIIVLVSILIIGAFIWVLDFGFGFGFGKLIDKAGQEATDTQTQTQQLPIDATAPAGEGVEQSGAASQNNGN